MMPEPLNVTVDLVEELLAIISWPVVAPAAVGTKLMLNVADWPGVNVRGELIPDTVNPVPVIVAELIVTGAVPDDDKITDCVDELFTATLPKAMLLALRVSAGSAAFS